MQIDGATPSEDFVSRCVDVGEIADFSQFDGPNTVRASVLRTIYFGLDTDQARGKAGLRLKGARVEGVFTVAGASAKGGAALPGLSFIECELLETLDVTDSHIFSLVLEKSKFSGVAGRGVIIDGELDIMGVKPLTDDGLAFVNVRSGRISGNIYAQNARLRGLDRDPFDETYANEYRYALRLTETHIGGSVYLTHGVYADGGVVIRNSHVGGNVWADGAEVMAADGYAFSLQGSRIGGGVRFTDGLFKGGEKRKFTSVGAVCLRQAVIEGSVRFDGGRFEASSQPKSVCTAAGKPLLPGMDRAIDMERAAITGDVSFGTPGQNYEIDPDETIVVGDVSLAGAAITGDLTWSNLVAEQAPGQAHMLFNAESVHVGRRLRAHHLVTPKMTPAKAGDDLGPLTFRFRAARVGLLQDIYRGAKEKIAPWGPTFVRLEIDGFKYALLSTRDGVNNTPFDRIRARFENMSPSLKVLLFPYLAIAWIWASLQSARQSLFRSYSSPAQTRLEWLDRLYPRDWLGGLMITRRTFRSQPYAEAARAFAEVGLDADARTVQLQQLRLIRKTGRLYRVPDRWLFDLLFGYGISPWRAIRTLIVAFLIGWFGVWRANTGGMLELGIQPTAELSNYSRLIQQLDANRRGEDADAFPNIDARRVQLPCGSEVNNALYALDVFIPLVDLRQDSECEIPADPVPETLLIRAAGPDAGPMMKIDLPWPASLLTTDGSVSFRRQIQKTDVFGFFSIPTNHPDFWRISRAIYALSGWIFISLSILTFSGILRRQQ